jgi:hypothetical protein
MIFRAVFWIGLVALLMPHEPDLGLGRPGAGISLPATVKSWAVTGLSRPDCDGEGCAGGLGALETLRTMRSPTGRTLADVKADLDASIRARAEHTHSDT